jgi:tetratricopeptide (TPR) repeat protein
MTTELMREPLAGTALENFLDETEQAVELQHEAGVADDLRRSTLLSALCRQPCRADTVQTVDRLHSLWRLAGEREAALRVLDEDGAEVLASLPADEQPGVAIALDFWRLGVRLRTGDAGENIARALQVAEQRLMATPPAHVSDKAWAHLASVAAELGDHACVRRCAEARQARFEADPERIAFRAWDRAVLALRVGHSHAAQGHPEDARMQGLLAIRTLAEAGADQELNSTDWLNLGESVIELVPEAISDIQQHARAALPADTPLPRQRELEVRLARLEARSLYLQGQLERALAVAEKGRFGLTDDSEDTFSAWVLDRLLEAGRKDAAAQLAFENVFGDRSALHACQHAKEQLARGERNPYWALALATVGLNENQQEVCGDEEPMSFAARHLALAIEHDPAHPAVSLMRALHLLTTQSDYAAAMPLLEAATACPDLASSHAVRKLWMCRMQVYGVRKALELPFVATPAGSWCYTVGVMLEDMHEELPEDAEWPVDQVTALRQRYYEHGQACFETFFESEQGRFGDGNVHDYSMLCNNLGILYRSRSDQYDAALALHRKGIAASPFAEHYDGVMWCQHLKKDQAAFVEAAEALWHFAHDYGYSRHAPMDYLPSVARALYKLERDKEIAIWLQRFEEWWAQLPADEQASQDADYLLTASCFAVEMAYDQPADTQARIESLVARCRRGQNFDAMSNLALAFTRMREYPRALELCRELRGWPVPAGADAQARRERLDLIEGDCSKGSAPSSPRPWWRFWG